jgi:hypothetical protein
MQPGDDEQFERYLKQFQPHPPRQLILTARASGRTWRLPLAIAALIVLSLGVVLWNAARPVFPIQPRQAQPVVTQASSPVTLGQLNRLMRDDPAKLEAQLSEASRKLLPDVRRPEGTLSALARD